MTPSLTDRPEAVPAASAADEVDLRKLVFALLAWWPEIVLLAALAAVAGGGLATISRPTWQATAAVVIVPPKAEAVFDQRFSTRTKPDHDIGSASRQETLRGLVLKSNVALAVIDALGNQLDEHERNPAWLIDRVLSVHSERPSLRESQLILIAAETNNPEKAATIANAWATAYVREVNRLYTGIPDETLVLMRKRVVEARSAYDAAQQKVEELIASGEASWIKQQIQLQTLALEARNETVSMHQDQRRRLDRLLANARGLRAQIEAGAGNALAIHLLKATVFTSPPQTLEFSLDGGRLLETSTADQATDVEALIRTLQERIEQTDRTIKHLLYGDAPAPVAGSQSAPRPPLHPPDQTERALQWLEMREEARMAKHRVIVAERERSWDALAALNDAQLGLEIAASSAIPKVRLAAAAIPPISPASFSPRTLAAVGAALGLLAGIALAAGANFLGIRPFLRKRA